MNTFKCHSIGIVGGGRVGATLGRALENTGYTIGGISGSSKESLQRIKKLLPNVPVRTVDEVVRENRIVILAVPDDKLEEIIRAIDNSGSFSKNQFVLHTSGSKGLEVFKNVNTPIKTIAFHPAMTFTGSRYDVRRLVGATYGVTINNVDSNSQENKLANELVKNLVGTIVMLNDEQRILYHAALTLGSNYMVTLVTEAFTMLEASGIDNAKEILSPLLKASLGNVLFKQGEALSGPISRGDVNVIEQHRKVINEIIPEILPVYDSLGLATVDLAEATDRISEESATNLRDSISKELD